MSSYHVHRRDDTGVWNCSGPHDSVKDAERDVQGSIRTRETKCGEKWKKAPSKDGVIKTWANEKGHTFEIVESK